MKEIFAWYHLSCLLQTFFRLNSNDLGIICGGVDSWDGYERNFRLVSSELSVANVPSFKHQRETFYSVRRHVADYGNG